MSRMLEVVVVAVVTAVVMYCCSYFSPCAPIPAPSSLEQWSPDLLLPETQTLRTLESFEEFGDQDIQCDMVRNSRAGMCATILVVVTVYRVQIPLYQS